MGNKASMPSNIPKSPHDILEVPPNATEEQIKSQYTKLLLKYHPDRGREKNSEKTMEIMKAYKTLKENNFKYEKSYDFIFIDFKKYTNDYFKKLLSSSDELFFKKVNEIYDLIEKNEQLQNDKIKLPKFGDKFTKNPESFYSFFKGFRTSIKLKFGNDIKFEKEERTMYNDSVRELTKIIYLCDPRLRMKIHDIGSLPVKPIKIKKPKVRIRKNVEQYAFYCDACCKGFMSENTMLNHKKSEKHKLKIIEMGFEEKSYEEIVGEKFKNDENTEGETESQNTNEDLITENEDCFELNKERDDITSQKSKIDENKNLIESNKDEAIENTKKGVMADDKKIEKELVKKINKISVKSKKSSKTIKKKNVSVTKENEQMLKCAYCKIIFESRNKLFAHIRELHGNKK